MVIFPSVFCMFTRGYDTRFVQDSGPKFAPDLLPSARGKLWSPCLVQVGFYNILLSDPLMKTCSVKIEDCQEFAASAAR